MAALPTTNLSTTTVANALETSSRDVGTLCTHENINKWAKYKPVCYYTTVAGDRDTIAKAKYNNADGTGRFGAHANGDYGIAPGYMEERDFDNTGDQVREACEYDWHYQGPTGGASFPYRLGDFRGYDKEAQPFLTFRSAEGATYDDTRDRFVVNPLVNDRVVFRFNYNSKDDHPNWVCADDMISLADLDFTKAYIMCAIYHHTSPSDRLIVLRSTIDEMGTSGSENGWIVNPQYGYPNDLYIEVDTVNFDLQSTNYVYFAIIYQDSDGTNRVASLPYPTTLSGTLSLPLTLYVEENTAQAGLAIDRETARISPNYVNSASAASNSRLLSDVTEYGSYKVLCSGRLSFQFTFKNDSDTAKSFTTNYFRLVEEGYHNNYIQLQNVWSEEDGSMSEFTVPAHGEVTVWMPFEGELVNPPTSSVNYSLELSLIYDNNWNLWYDTINMGYGNGFEAL